MSGKVYTLKDHLKESLKDQEFRKVWDKTMSKKCVVLIDGSNFYFKMKDLSLHDQTKFDFSTFAKTLAGKDRIIHATYYVGAVRTDGTKKVQNMFNQQRKLLAHLKKLGINYSLGYLLKSGGNFKEKGVDVRMAVDMLVTTYEHLADRIILICSDTDLLPAAAKAMEKGKIVEYVGFAHQPSKAMKLQCSKFRLLKKDDLLPFVKQEM